ncbi:hypothetical protein RF11_16286 [Thelohanellus kitauei]|uniref:Uncharacterized protein n=1 Tax=Thelohanellus kitauei TaxID=669202 RepID=A0A0C2MSG0_THEKT|nr:hypothetical protein RF11_16286 [Thelohanellus kitauei]
MFFEKFVGPCSIVSAGSHDQTTGAQACDLAHICPALCLGRLQSTTPCVNLRLVLYELGKCNKWPNNRSTIDHGPILSRFEPCRLSVSKRPTYTMLLSRQVQSVNSISRETNILQNLRPDVPKLQGVMHGYKSPEDRKAASVTGQTTSAASRFMCQVRRNWCPESLISRRRGVTNYSAMKSLTKLIALNRLKGSF